MLLLAYKIEYTGDLQTPLNPSLSDLLSGNGWWEWLITKTESPPVLLGWHRSSGTPREDRRQPLMSSPSFLPNQSGLLSSLIMRLLISLSKHRINLL